jgi:hypothetical protein
MNTRLLNIFESMYLNNSAKIDELTNQNNIIMSNIMEIYRSQCAINGASNTGAINGAINGASNGVISGASNGVISGASNGASGVINDAATSASQNINSILRNFNLPFNIPNNIDLSNNIPVYFNYQVYTQNLDPVIVHPSNEQIDTATENLLFGNIINPININCPISLEQFLNTSNVTIIKHCKHIFNTNNLMNWFRTNCKCPVCRFDIREYVNNSNNTSEEEELDISDEEPILETSESRPTREQIRISLPIQSLLNNIQTLSESRDINDAQQIVSDFINIFSNLNNSNNR